MAKKVVEKPGEEVLLTLRKNPFYFRMQIAKFSILVLAGFLLFVYFQNQYVILAAIFLLLAAFFYGLYYFIIWFYDSYVVTNRRVIVIKQKSLFSREVIEADVARINDVSYSTKGILATLFRYGTVKIRTAFGLSLELTDLSNPAEVQDMISNLVEITFHHRERVSREDLLETVKGLKK